MKLTKGLIKADIIAARQAIEYFDQNHIKDIKNIAAYHLQQAAEKLIKLQIYKALQTTEDRKMYTHDLSKLIEYAEAESIKLIVPEYIRDHVNSITEWEAGNRYDIGFSIRIDTLKKCYGIVADWESQV
ncbi:MAG: HEPN domain-containing protein [Butyrivibrio sp.]|nr:HEPN domain-containing protein [Butyrivibrio sp.]MBR1642147.1 HEPN domain-containing protein [Butyrivibrio sp.]